MQDSHWLDSQTLQFGDHGDTRLKRTSAGALNLPTAHTLALTDADALTVGGKIIRQTWAVDVKFTASSVDQWIYIAPRACKVVSVSEVHSVIGGSGANVIARKVTDTSAPGATAGATVTNFTQAVFDLTSAINTVVAGTLSATAADYTLAAGDKIGIKFTGTLTGLAGAVIGIELQAI